MKAEMLILIIMIYPDLNYLAAKPRSVTDSTLRGIMNNYCPLSIPFSHTTPFYLTHSTPSAIEPKLQSR